MPGSACELSSGKRLRNCPQLARAGSFAERPVVAEGLGHFKLHRFVSRLGSLLGICLASGWNSPQIQRNRPALLAIRSYNLAKDCPMRRSQVDVFTAETTLPAGCAAVSAAKR